MAQLLSPELTAEAAKAGDPLERLSARLPEAFSRFTPLGQAQYLEIVTFLESYLLHTQGDRMLMGHGIEGRFPFLDYRVAELAASLPDEYRLLGLREKVILRRVARPLLPPEIVSRKKQPYRAPIAPALVGPDAPEAVREALAPERVASAGLFRPEAVAAVVRKCEGAGAAGVGETDEMALVGVVSTMLLHDRFVERPLLAPATAPTRLVVGDTVVPPEDLRRHETLESAA
jgi:asparagine synthase (glutamine-hydrolysing)